MNKNGIIVVGLLAVTAFGGVPPVQAGPEECVLTEAEPNPNPDPLPGPNQIVGCVLAGFCLGPNIVKYSDEQDFFIEDFYPPLGIENGQDDGNLGAFLLIPPPPRMDPDYVYYAILAGWANVQCEIGPICHPVCDLPICDGNLDEVFDDLREKAEQNNVVRIALHASMNGNYNATVDEMEDYWNEYGLSC